MNGVVHARREDHLLTVTLAHPSRKNALTAAMWQRLAEIFAAASEDSDLRCVVVTGEGDDFAAGGDLVEMEQLRRDLEGALAYHQMVAKALAAVGGCPLPTIARIRGACVGGGLEIAAACDLRIADETARLGAPINRLGFSMVPGELALILALAGPAVAKEILLEGRLYSAQEAYEKGLLTRFVPPARLDAEIAATTERIVAGAPLVARWHKQWISRLTKSVFLSEEEQRAAFAFLATADYREGMAAFREKRSPHFVGR